MIVSLLASIVIPNIDEWTRRADEQRVNGSERSVQVAVDMFMTKEGRYPTSEGQPNLVSKPVDFERLIPTYLKDIETKGESYFVDPDGSVYATTSKEEKIKSGNLSVWNMDDLEQIKKDVKEMRLNTVNVPVIIDIPATNSDTMTVNPTSKDQAVEVIKMLKAEGVHVILEPYPFISSGTVSETLWNPEDINTFFWNWKTVVLRQLIDDIAVPYDVFALNVSSNLTNVEYAEGYWVDTVSYVRNTYSGKVTYRTNWWATADWAPESIEAYERKLNNVVFGVVDFISVSAYFELNEEGISSPKTIASDLRQTRRYDRRQDVYRELKMFNDRWGKPIFLGELGAPKKEGASMSPWDNLSGESDSTIAQANLFDGYRLVFEEEKWLMGFSVFHIGQDNEWTTFYPSEESKRVIRNWYAPN